MSSPLNLTFDINSNGQSTATSDKIPTYKILSERNVASIFGTGQFSPFPAEGGVDAKSGNVTSIRSAEDVNNDDTLNKMSISEIIDYCNRTPSMRLSFADFAYLKNVGVFPNNRLIIARRFPSGVSNDLTSIKSQPMSTLISWVPDDQEFISVEFGEEWTDADASFTDILNDIGGDISASPDNRKGMQELGTKFAEGFFGLPLPGFMEGLQYAFLNKLGLTDTQIGNSPLGNPNLIRQAKRRQTIEANRAGSGLSAKFTVKMVVEYEQKFINGVDPSLVYLDIIQNALTFGTSDAQFQFTPAFAKGTGTVIANLISGDLKAISQGISDFVQKLLEVIKEIGEKLISKLVAGADAAKEDDRKDSSSVYDAISTAFAATIGHVISKYKIKLLGVANALTGSPSTPWHVTIGNPKKPIFSSGDMLCTNVTLTLGKTLSYNDLPSYIRLEFDLTNARPLGAQEIFNRFNTGRGRSYVRRLVSYVEKGEKELTVATASNPGTSSVTFVTTPAKVDEPTKDDYLVPIDNLRVDRRDYIVPNTVPVNPQVGPITTNPQIPNSTGVQSSNQFTSTIDNRIN